MHDSNTSGGYENNQLFQSPLRIFNPSLFQPISFKDCGTGCLIASKQNIHENEMISRRPLYEGGRKMIFTTSGAIEFQDDLHGIYEVPEFDWYKLMLMGVYYLTSPPRGDSTCGRGRMYLPNGDYLLHKSWTQGVRNGTHFVTRSGAVISNQDQMEALLRQHGINPDIELTGSQKQESKCRNSAYPLFPEDVQVFGIASKVATSINRKLFISKNGRLWRINRVRNRDLTNTGIQI